ALPPIADVAPSALRAPQADPHSHHSGRPNRRPFCRLDPLETPPSKTEIPSHNQISRDRRGVGERLQLTERWQAYGAARSQLLLTKNAGADGAFDRLWSTAGTTSSGKS